jgi:dihydrofolate reductase
MRKVVVSEFMTLDGVIEDPSWTFCFHSEEQEAFKFAELKTADALLLGRVTYEGLAAAWPGMAEQTGEYGAMMNGYPKYVASTTLATTEWNASLIKGDLADEITALKRQPGRDILVFGSGRLIQTLLRHDLIDEYRLLVFPVVLGLGQRLFTEGLAATLRLVEATPFRSGVVALTYRPSSKEAPTGRR